MKSTLGLLKINFSLNSNYLRYAIRLAISCFIVVALYELLQLKNGYWAAFSVIACVWPTLGQSVQRSKHRMVGTFIGMWIGILIAHSFGSNRALIDFLLPIFIFFTFYLKVYSYSLFVIFTTVVTVLFICLIVPGDWQVAITRLEMTTIGTVIAIVATFFIFPSRASISLPRMFSSVKKSIKQYYFMIAEHYVNHKKHNLQTAQSQTFKNLQATLEIIKESRQEYWRLSKQYQENSALYQALDAAYQCLMILEIHLPEQIKAVQLHDIAQKLQGLLTDIGLILSHFDAEKTKELIRKLTDFRLNIQQQRVIACKDLTIQTATFFEHMQLTICINTLINLLNAITNLESVACENIYNPLG